MAATDPSRKSVAHGLKRALSWVKTVLSWLGNYWVRAVIIAILGIYLGEKLDDTESWVRIRYEVFQFLQNLSWQKPEPQRTVLVLIGDEEYWKGELHFRAPIKRDYLARIVDAAAAANAAVIALDFDLRSSSPEGTPREDPEYQGETDKLKQAITTAASSRKKIVLAKTIGMDNAGNYVIESDIYDPIPAEWQNVRLGYHVFSDDTRLLPPVLNTSTGPLEPFSLAIARAENARSLKNISDFTETRYAGFLPRTTEFDIVSAHELLNGERKWMLENKVVIVGGVWHALGYNRGPQVSSYDTPIGTIPGVFIHANYFEALFASRLYRVWEGWSMRITEFILAMLVALPFGFSYRSKTKRALVVASPYLLIVIISYFSLMNFGWFFDPFIPVLSVTAHGVLERVLHWRAAAQGHAA